MQGNLTESDLAVLDPPTESETLNVDHLVKLDQLVPPIEGARKELEELIKDHKLEELIKDHKINQLDTEEKTDELLRSISLPSFPESFKVRKR